jgi:Ca2+-binding EF-hand superfamily protein
MTPYRKMLPEMFRRIDVDDSGQISVEVLHALRVRGA